MDYDWSYLGIILARLFSLSLVVQLALEALFRWDGFSAIEVRVKARLGFGLKFPVAFVLSWALARQTDFDVIADLFSASNGVAGYLVTALAVCGGTAPFLAVFAKIEAAREASKTVIVQAQAARANGGAS